MNIAARLRKLEYMTTGTDEVKIKITRHHSHAEWFGLKQLFDAKRVLGLLTPQQIRRTIFVGRETREDDQQTMTREQARTILNNQPEVPA